MTHPLVLSTGHTVHIKGLSGVSWRILGFGPNDVVLVESLGGCAGTCSLTTLRAWIQEGTIIIERGES